MKIKEILKLKNLLHFKFQNCLFIKCLKFIIENLQVKLKTIIQVLFFTIKFYHLNYTKYLLIMKIFNLFKGVYIIKKMKNYKKK